jgi:pyrroline-5-carboxylate reductase
MRLAVIGTGKMGQAIVSGLLSRHIVSPSYITGVSNDEESKKSFLQLDPAGGLTWTDSISKAVQGADVILLSVKPFQMSEVLKELSAQSVSALSITIAAGLRLEFYLSVLGSGTRLARAMPNTPVTLRAGVIAYAPSPACTPQDLTQIEAIFQSVGHCYRVEEPQLDAITALSGSGPAFVYRIIEALAAAGVKEGLSPEQALPIAAQTLLGAARMIQESGASPDVLVSQVVSKGGTTEAGLKILESSAMSDILAATILAAADRSRELSKS